MITKEIMSTLEKLSPVDYACSWDNVGLLVGDPKWEVTKVVVALDATKKAIDYALKEGAGLLITHHPMIFSSIKRVHEDDLTGSKILTLAANRIGCYAMHTNFDIKGGMADLASERICLINPSPLEVTTVKDDQVEGIGRIGTFKNPMTLEACANLIKDKFQLPSVTVFGDLKTEIHVGAICPGSGKSTIMEAVQKGAQVLITGDIGHHEGLDAVEMGLNIIDAGHYGLEYIFIEFIKDYLKDNHGSSLEVLPYFEGSPFQVM